jgi:hypothetical protein
VKKSVSQRAKLHFVKAVYQFLAVIFMVDGGNGGFVGSIGGGSPGGRFVTGILGSNPARSMDFCLYVSVLCCPVQVEAFATG